LFSGVAEGIRTPDNQSHNLWEQNSNRFNNNEVTSTPSPVCTSKGENANDDRPNTGQDQQAEDDKGIQPDILAAIAAKITPSLQPTGENYLKCFSESRGIAITKFAFISKYLNSTGAIVTVLG
jgi:hypothetical protein